MKTKENTKIYTADFQLVFISFSFKKRWVVYSVEVLWEKSPILLYVVLTLRVLKTTKKSPDKDSDFAWRFFSL